MCRKLLGIVILLWVSLPLLARGQDLTTGNQFVVGIVSGDGSGRVSWEQGNVTKLRSTWKPLSFIQHSYLDLKIDGLYYSNNDLMPTKIGPPETITNRQPDVLLSNGSNQKIGDTIETTWHENNFDIVQDVYPVAFTSSGQIIAAFKVINHAAAPLNSVQAEFLLDIGVQNDKANMLTQVGYSPNWELFQNPPRFFMAFGIPPGQPGFPGITGMGYPIDSNAEMPLGVLTPSTFIIGDWNDLSYFKWGYPNTKWNSPYMDNAVLYEWPQTSVMGNASQLIGNLTYGTGEDCQNFGQVFAVLLRPGMIQYNTDQQQYVKNPFNVEALIFNMSSTNSISNVKAALTVGDSLHILSSQQRTTSPSTISPLSVADAGWSVSASNAGSDPDTSFISLDVTGTGLTPPAFVDSWDCPTFVSSTKTSGKFPFDTILSRTGSYDGSICNAHCSQDWTYDQRLCFNCGISGVHTDTAMNMSVTVQDSFAHFTACVIDSMKNGFANVIVSDLDGSRDTVRFNYCTIADTLAPWFDVQSDDSCAGCHRIYLRENRPWDRGLDTIVVKSIAGLRIDGSTPVSNPNFIVRGLPWAMISTVPSGSGVQTICVEAIDRAGNKRDSCMTFATANIEPLTSTIFSLRVAPNPSYGNCTLTLDGPGNAAIEVLDVLGRIVDRFEMTGSREWDMSRLVSGTYIVRANANGIHTSTRIIKE